MCVEGSASRWLAEVVVWGGWSCTSAATRGVGRFFNSSGEEKHAVFRPSGAVLGGLAGIAELRGPASCSVVGLDWPLGYCDLPEVLKS